MQLIWGRGVIQIQLCLTQETMILTQLKLQTAIKNKTEAHAYS